MKRYSITDYHKLEMSEDENGDWIKYKNLIKLIEGEIDEWKDVEKRSKENFDAGCVYGLEIILHLMTRD